MITNIRRIWDQPNDSSSSARRMKKLSRVALYITLIILAILMVLPLAWMIITSFRPDYSLGSVSSNPFRAYLNWNNYIVAWQRANFSQYTLNTAIYATICTIGQVFLGAMAGYAFARLKFRGSDVLFIMVLVTMMIPFQMLLVPLFVMLRHWPLAGGNNLLGTGGTGLIDSLPGLILPNLVTPFGIFLMRQFTLSLPSELADAARIDGANEFQIFSKIMLPLTKPALVTLGIFAFQEAWNDFTWPLIVSTTAHSRTLQLGLQTFQDQTLTEWGPLMAGTVITVLPLLLIFIVGQRYFVEGIALTGTKG